MDEQEDRGRRKTMWHRTSAGWDQILLNIILNMRIFFLLCYMLKTVIQKKRGTYMDTLDHLLKQTHKECDSHYSDISLQFAAILMFHGHKSIDTENPEKWTETAFYVCVCVWVWRREGLVGCWMSFSDLALQSLFHPQRTPSNLFKIGNMAFRA